MKASVMHPVYGEIVYAESLWSGRQELFIGGVAARRVSKRVYLWEGRKVALVGSYLSGVTLRIEGETVEIIPKVKWYEVAIALVPFVFLLVWGNSVTLCSIFPVVGGAIGGAWGMVGLMAALFLMKRVRTAGGKLLVGACVFAATVASAFGLAMALMA